MFFVKKWTTVRSALKMSDHVIWRISTMPGVAARFEK